MTTVRFGTGLLAKQDIIQRTSNTWGPKRGLQILTEQFNLPSRIASKVAWATPSMDTIMISLPGLRPASSMAWMAPKAMSSLWAKTAVIFLASGFFQEGFHDFLALQLW